VIEIPFADERLAAPWAKVQRGERLTPADGLLLYQTPDLLGVGAMANRVRERMHGNVTWFNVNRHINPTDVCTASCRLCAFGKGVRDPRASTMRHEEIWQRAGEGWTESITEFHIVGGLHPTLTLDWYCEMLRGLKRRFPSVHLKCFTMVEIGYFAERSKLTVEQVLTRLREAGMDSMPGGGAEIFHDRVRRIICDHKLTGDEWIETARIAHRLGLQSNCTMLYGHIETSADRVDHLVRLRELQDDTQGFQTFIPLAFHPANTALDHLPPTSGMEDIRNIAVARLMLDNIPHIKAYWIMMTPEIAQVALRFGADDIDGTVIEERIYHDAGAATSQGMRRQDLLRLIREAGREPRERDTLYRPVDRPEVEETPRAALTVLV
jgi:aminodeoxyfutalosine synthase